MYMKMEGRGGSWREEEAKWAVEFRGTFRGTIYPTLRYLTLLDLPVP